MRISNRNLAFIVIAVLCVILGLVCLAEAGKTSQFDTNMNALTGSLTNKDAVTVAFNDKCNLLSQTGLLLLVIGLVMLAIQMYIVYFQGRVSLMNYSVICAMILFLPVIIAMLVKKLYKPRD